VSGGRARGNQGAQTPGWCTDAHVLPQSLRRRASAPSYPTRMLLVVSLGWATIQCGRFVLPPLIPAIRTGLGLSEAGIGLAFTAFGLLYAVIQYPSGASSDTLSRATLILPGFVTLVASLVVLGLATTTVLFVAGILLLGVCKGLYTPPSRALLGDLFTARRGRALGIYSAGTDLGGLAASGIAFVILSTAALAWQAAFIPLAVIAGLVTVLFAVWNRESLEPRRVEMDPAGTLGRLLATPAQRNLLVAYSIFFFVVGGIITFLPELLIEFGVAESLAAGFYSLLFVVGLVIKPAAGELSDRFPRLGVSIAMLVTSAAGVCGLLLFQSIPALVVGTVVTAVGYKTQFPITDAVILEAAPSENMGGDLGAARAVFLGTNSLGPGFVGVVADQASFALAFWALAAGLLLSAGILALQYRRQ
jgi:MFS family permease